VYRAYFSTPATVTAPDGTSVNAAHGFLGMVARLVDDWNPSHLACAIDMDWRPSWRVDLIPSYKTHRLADPDAATSGPYAWAEAGFADQVPLIYDLLENCGVAVVGVEGQEAEDVIGSLASEVDGEVLVVSGDRDLFQLVVQEGVKVIYPRRGVSQVTLVDAAEVERRFGIPGEAYRDFSVLRGDPSDGLPGVKGIGEKTAASLLKTYGSLEAIVSAAAEDPKGALARVAASFDYLDRAVRVVTIRSDLDIGNADLTRPRPDPGEEDYRRADGWGLLGAFQRLASALRGDQM
jgi:5'-3' exonuclease